MRISDWSSDVCSSDLLDPTVINGGIINSYGSNARLGEGEWMVVEADESDGSFLRLDGTVAVVTNIDPEHLDHYGDFDRVKNAFVKFVENVRSEEHTSELQSLMRNSYAVFCLKKKHTMFNMIT